MDPVWGSLGVVISPPSKDLRIDLRLLNNKRKKEIVTDLAQIYRSVLASMLNSSHLETDIQTFIDGTF